MRSLLVSVMVLILAANARRSRWDMWEDKKDTDTDEAGGLQFPVGAFEPREATVDAIVRDPLENRSKLPVDMLMAEFDDEYIPKFLEWQNIYGDGGRRNWRQTRRAFSNWKRANEVIKQSFYDAIGKSEATVL